MTSNSIGENPSVALRSNWLTVNDTTLRADVLLNSRSEKISVSPISLEAVLVLGRRAIAQGIEAFYEEQATSHPGATIARPSIWVAQLGTTTQTDGRNSRVFTEKGYANGGVITFIEEIQPRFHNHWNAVRDAGFLPEVRRTIGKEDAGSWILLRKPSLDEVVRHWFGKKGSDASSTAEWFKDDDKAAERRKLRLYRMIGEKAVDQEPDNLRSREQVCLILSMAAIKFALGDKDGYEEEVNDALQYADNDTSMDISTVRAIENSTFEIGD